MKAIKTVILTGVFLTALGISAMAQETSTRTDAREGWNQGRAAIISLGIGGTRPIAVGSSYAYLLHPGLSTNISAEFRVHRFVGFGFQTGVNTHFERKGTIVYYPEGVVVRTWRRSIGIPFALKTNIHILEAANNRHADYLDVYAGMNVGGGPQIVVDPDGGGIFGFVTAGPQFGVRYWPKRSIGVFGEIGWGATFANVGVTF